MELETWIILESLMPLGLKDLDLDTIIWYLGSFKLHHSFFQVNFIFISEYAVKNIPRRYGIMFFYGSVMVTCLMFGFDFVQSSTILASILFAVYRVLASNILFN